MNPLLHGFFDELEKIADVPRGLLAMYLGAGRVKKGVRRHEEMMRAIREGYPAGWVALGMRPR